MLIAMTPGTVGYRREAAKWSTHPLHGRPAASGEQDSRICAPHRQPAARPLVHLLPLLPLFFGAAFFEGVGFFLPLAAADPRLPPKAVSQPSAYRWLVPTRVIVTA